MSPTRSCVICESSCSVNIVKDVESNECPRCGRYDASKEFIEDWPSHRKKSAEDVALASFAIRKLGRSGKLPHIESVVQFEGFLNQLSLNSPQQAADELIRFIGTKQFKRPGLGFSAPGPMLTSTIGLVDHKDINWLCQELKHSGLLESGELQGSTFSARLSFSGWAHYEALLKASSSGRFAFMARKFDNKELDLSVELCLKPAVKRTGYDLRIVTQRAGLIDSTIESEIRNCKFLISDLSNENAGAYWEAGLAEGLGKHVFYVCKKRVDGNPVIHFDTEHRMTIFWDPSNWKHSENALTAVIRNTLLGDAKQTDE